VIVLLFVGLGVAATLQFALGQHKHVQCPGPHAQLGRPNDIVRCVMPSPSAP